MVASTSKIGNDRNEREIGIVVNDYGDGSDPKTRHL